MRQHIEIIGKGSKIKETRTTKGWLYSLSLPITSTNRDGEELTEWLSCSIFQKDQRPELLKHDGEFHLIGELQVKAAWSDYPQKLGLFGFHIEPVLGRVWRVAGKRKKSEGRERDMNRRSRTSVTKRTVLSHFEPHEMRSTIRPPPEAEPDTGTRWRRCPPKNQT